MSEEHSLPPLLPPSEADYHVPLRGRKRGYDSSTSSEPPLFSSDDLPEASSDNYNTIDRRKRHYRGTWWGEKAGEASPWAESGRNKRALVRNIDSGVWLGSDGSDASDAMSGVYTTGEESVANHKSPVEELGGATRACITDCQPVRTARDFERATYGSFEELVAQDIIQSYLETNVECIDLSGCSLVTLSNETFRPLRYLIKMPKFHGTPPTQDYYGALTPVLRIFLSNNALRTVPLELFHLHHLTVLSLRNNELNDLPPAISKLWNLVELNLSCNRLRWLPWELLTLLGSKGSLRRLNIVGNPFVRPVVPCPADCLCAFPMPIRKIGVKHLVLSTPGDLDHLGLKLDPAKDGVCAYMSWLARVRRIFSGNVAAQAGPALSDPWPPQSDPIYLGHTPVAFLHVDGTRDRNSATAPSSLPMDQIYLPPAYPTESSPPKTNSRAPSLLELAMRTCLESPYIAQIRQLSGNHMSDAIYNLLQEAESMKTYGKHRCSVCSREYVIPRTEWIEYWFYAWGDLSYLEDVATPFLRRGCSWACVPEEIVDTGSVP